ncbi:MAG: hypothetical protein LBT60_02185 [Oscillospiraceae bacterium]|jgi:hypothetical protein|nr:hypothetical protein [Oscillospiraceae bacterium]
MDDMESKIGALLADPEAMQKVMGMARALGAGDKTKSPVEADAKSGSGGGQGEGLGGFGGLGGLLGGLQNMDPKLMSGLMRVLGAYSGEHSHRETLLLSLKPYLRVERQGKVERAAQIMRMARTARIGIKTFLGGEEDA